jgi:hypothetical protein
LVLLILCFSTCAFAQDTIHSAGKSRFSPIGASAEFAGGFGMASCGLIFSPIHGTKLNLTLGYTPPNYGNIWTGNVLFDYSIVRIHLNRNMEFKPVNLGVFLNFSLGKNIHPRWPSHYPEDYYWWNSSLRFGPRLESELIYSFGENRKKISASFQCLTNDLYLYSYAVNTKTISFADILIFGLGLKYYFGQDPRPPESLNETI